MNLLKLNKKNGRQKKLVYRTYDYTYSFKNFWTMNTFGRDIYNGKTTLKETD